MAIQFGKNLLLKIKRPTSTAYETIAGLRAHEITFNTQPIDVTNADSIGQWRELLNASGIRDVRIAGQGVFRDASADSYVRASVMQIRHADWTIVMPSFGQITGKFVITTLRYAGSFESELNWDMELQSSGAINFA